MPTYRCWIADEIMAARHPEFRHDQTDIEADNQEEATFQALLRFEKIEKSELEGPERLELAHIQCELIKG